MMRVHESRGFRAEGEEHVSPIGERVKRRGRRWQGQGAWSEQGERLTGILLVGWEGGEEETLAVVTDETGPEAEIAFSHMRIWTDDGFTEQKRGDWRGEQTKRTDPQRASRLWVALAVTMGWAVRVGREEEGRAQHTPRSARGTPPGKRGRLGTRFRRPRDRPALAETPGRRGHSCSRRRCSRRERHRTQTWKQEQQARVVRERERDATCQETQRVRVHREQEQQAHQLARTQKQEAQRLARLAREQQAHTPPEVESHPEASSAVPAASAARFTGAEHRSPDRPAPVLCVREKHRVPLRPATVGSRMSSSCAPHVRRVAPSKAPRRRVH